MLSSLLAHQIYTQIPNIERSLNLSRAIFPAEYVWVATIQLAPLFWIKGWDSYVNGAGESMDFHSVADIGSCHDQ